MAEMTRPQMAKEIIRLRKQAKDESIPQNARNDMLDEAAALEYKMYEMVKKEEGMAKGGAVKKKPAAKKASRQSPVVAVMIGMTDKPARKAPKRGGRAMKAAKGGYANCGASMKPAQKGKK